MQSGGILLSQLESISPNTGRKEASKEGRRNHHRRKECALLIDSIRQQHTWWMMQSVSGQQTRWKSPHWQLVLLQWAECSRATHAAFRFIQVSQWITQCITHSVHRALGVSVSHSVNTQESHPVSVTVSLLTSALFILRPYVSICLPISSAVDEKESSCMSRLAFSCTLARNTCDVVYCIVLSSEGCDGTWQIWW